MTLVDRDRRLDRRADRPRARSPIARLAEADLGLVELLDRVPAGPHQEVGEVVEVAVEDRAAEAGPRMTRRR